MSRTTHRAGAVLGCGLRTPVPALPRPTTQNTYPKVHPPDHNGHLTSKGTKDTGEVSAEGIERMQVLDRPGSSRNWRPVSTGEAHRTHEQHGQHHHGLRIVGRRRTCEAAGCVAPVVATCAHCQRNCCANHSDDVAALFLDPDPGPDLTPDLASSHGCRRQWFCSTCAAHLAHQQALRAARRELQRLLGAPLIDFALYRALRALVDA